MKTITFKEAHEKILKNQIKSYCYDCSNSGMLSDSCGAIRGRNVDSIYGIITGPSFNTATIVPAHYGDNLRETIENQRTQLERLRELFENSQIDFERLRVIVEELVEKVESIHEKNNDTGN